MESLVKMISSLGIHCSLEWREHKTDRKGVSGRSLMGRIKILRFGELQRFMQLLPIRHQEKVARKSLALSLKFGSSIDERPLIVNRWKQLTARFHDEVRYSVKAAKDALTQREDFLSVELGI
jgi:hypothetical protein